MVQWRSFTRARRVKHTPRSNLPRSTHQAMLTRTGMDQLLANQMQAALLHQLHQVWGPFRMPSSSSPQSLWVLQLTWSRELLETKVKIRRWGRLQAVKRKC